MGGRTAGAGRDQPAAIWAEAGAGAGPGRIACSGAGLRRLPDRPARYRGRLACPPGARHPRPHGGGHGGGPRRKRRRLRRGRPGRGRVAAAHLRDVPLLPARGREPVSRLAVHRLGRRRRLRRVRPLPAAYAYRLPAASPTPRWRRCCAPGSSATARSARVAAAGRAARTSTGSATAPTSPPRSRWPQGATVHVFTRGEPARGWRSSSARHRPAAPHDAPPEPLDSAILFAPVGDLVPVALRALDRGGVLAVAGIHLTDIPPLNYERELFYEKATAQRHRPTPARTGGVPGAGRPVPRAGHHAPVPDVAGAAGAAGPQGGRLRRGGRSRQRLGTDRPTWPPDLTGHCRMQVWRRQ